MAFHDSHPEVRAWNLDNDDIRRHGALFNAFYGAPLTGLVQGGADTSSMLLILFAGFGTGTTDFNFACMTPGMVADIHTHPSRTSASSTGPGGIRASSATAG